MGKIDDKLASMGITLPVEQAPIANYVPGVRTGNLLYLSGIPHEKVPSSEIINRIVKLVEDKVKEKKH